MNHRRPAAPSLDGKLTIRSVTRILIVVAAILVIISLTTQVMARQLDMDPNRFTLSFFNLDVERNVPTTFQALLLFGNAMLFAGIALLKWSTSNRWRWHWAILSAIFVLLTWDEIIEVHEHLIHIMRPFGLSGIFYFAWIIPAAVAVAILGVAYLRFVLAMSNPPRNRIIIAGVIYLTAIFPFEAIGGWYFERMGEQVNIQYVLLTTVEETLEMVALIVLLHALARYLGALLALASIEVHGDPDHFWFRVRPASRSKVE